MIKTAMSKLIGSAAILATIGIIDPAASQSNSTADQSIDQKADIRNKAAEEWQKKWAADHGLTHQSATPDLSKTHTPTSKELDEACDKERTADACTRAIDANKTNPTNYLYRAWQYRNWSKYADAIADFSTSIQLNPNYAEAYYGRAVAYSGAGDNEKARQDLETALRLKPDYTDAKKALDEVADDVRRNAAADALAQRFPFEAVLSCGSYGANVYILACFARSGSYGSETELSITRAGVQHVYQVGEIANLPGTQGSVTTENVANVTGGMVVAEDGLHILLPEHFSINAQNSQEQLVMGVKITKLVNKEVVYQQEVGAYGVINVGN